MLPSPILIVDDLETDLFYLSATLEAAGEQVHLARTLKEARSYVQTARPTLALVDLVLPDGDGVEFIQMLSDTYPEIKVIAVTAYATVDRAVAAMRSGAKDFLVKPIAPEQLQATMQNVRTGRGFDQVPDATDVSTYAGHSIGSSDVMQGVFQTIQSVAESAVPVFITGESGTGKVKAARCIHDKSSFKSGPFVKLDCSTILSDRIAEELFGTLDGPDGQEHLGAVQRAQGGTLLLDEVCSLPMSMQAVLLNILQSGTVATLGGGAPQPARFRLICTSTVDPTTEVSEGRFRADLFYRLNVVPIDLPPLHTRGLDVIEIAEIELDLLCAREDRPFRTLSEEVKAIFLAHRWPGNIRELMNVLWNVTVLHDGPVIRVDDLPAYLRNLGEDTASLAGASGTPATSLTGKTLAEIEKLAVEAAIDEAGGSIPSAAKALAVSPSTLYRKLEAWGVPVRNRKS